jgi:hypothetical protein
VLGQLAEVLPAQPSRCGIGDVEHERPLALLVVGDKRTRRGGRGVDAKLGPVDAVPAKTLAHQHAEGIIPHHRAQGSGGTQTRRDAGENGWRPAGERAGELAGTV